MKHILRALIKERGFINAGGVKSYSIMEYYEDVLALDKAQWSKRISNISFTMREVFLICESLGVTIEDLIVDPKEVRDQRNTKREALKVRLKTKEVPFNPKKVVSTKPRSRQQRMKEQYDQARK